MGMVEEENVQGQRAWVEYTAVLGESIAPVEERRKESVHGGRPQSVEAVAAKGDAKLRVDVA